MSIQNNISPPGRMISPTEYSFRRVNGKLKHAPRTLNELEQKEHFEKAERSANWLYKENSELYADMLNLDGSEFDENPRPNEVLLKDYKDHRGNSISGHAFLDAIDGELMKAEKESRGRKTEFGIEEMPWLGVDNPLLHISRNSGTFSESIIENPSAPEASTYYSILASEEAPQYAKDLTDNPYKVDPSSWEDPIHSAPVGERVLLEPWVAPPFLERPAPRYVEDLEPRPPAAKPAENPLVTAGLETENKVRSLRSEVVALDNSEFDLNPRDGEVLLKDAQVGERVVSGFLVEDDLRYGFSAEFPSDRESYQSHFKFESSNTNESFEALHHDQSQSLRYRDADSTTEVFTKSYSKAAHVDVVTHESHPDTESIDQETWESIKKAYEDACR